ncbi:DUF6115 domain-containing protein [Aneurinibacillus terranovensis]|uniref:DUF6115 domain-containing protein n=1 Tax=Aneurinibacillus terranovensis TaxID=278991 RepID=UPI0003F88290|nr:hypothetical protein [Aneurinibacillus terranovensis]
MFIEIWLVLLTAVVLFLLIRTVRRPLSADNPALHDEMAAFFDEFEHENKEMMQSISQMKRSLDQKIDGQASELAALRREMGSLYTRCEHLQQLAAGWQQGPPEQKPAPAQVKPAFFLRDDYKDIPPLFYKGYSTQEIARKLGIGNGEVEMVVQMLKKHEANDQ